MRLARRPSGEVSPEERQESNWTNLQMFPTLHRQFASGSAVHSRHRPSPAALDFALCRSGLPMFELLRFAALPAA